MLVKPDFRVALFGKTYSERYDIPFKIRYYIRVWRMDWFLSGRPCWANNTTCKHNKRGRCFLHRPELVWCQDRWGCGDYTWSLEKLRGIYHGGKPITLNDVDKARFLTRTSEREAKTRAAKKIPLE